MLLDSVLGKEMLFRVPVTDRREINHSILFLCINNESKSHASHGIDYIT